MQEIILASSQFPSGVAWLLNFLLEIDICIYRGKSINQIWNINDNIYHLKSDEEVLKSWLPTLSYKSKYQFRDNISIKWTHDYPNHPDKNKKYILFVRDGRDAIYSYYKREGTYFSDFNQMLEQYFKPHYLPPALDWGLFNYLWTSIIPQDKLLIVKFEDIKLNPTKTAKKILDYLKISRTVINVQEAINNSSFEKAKKAEENYKKQKHCRIGIIANRKGKPGEWKQIYGQKNLGFFKGLPNFMLKYFDYNPINNNYFRYLEKFPEIWDDKNNLNYFRDYVIKRFNLKTKKKKYSYIEPMLNYLTDNQCFLIKYYHEGQLNKKLKSGLSKYIESRNLNSRDKFMFRVIKIMNGRICELPSLLRDKESFKWVFVIFKENYHRFKQIWIRYGF